MKTIRGFDYRTGKAVELTRKDWRDLMALAAAAGGDVNRQHGETFILAPRGKHDPRFELWAEAYELIY